MKFSKQAILARFHKIPTVRFEDQRLTSFGGVIVFQALFQALDLKTRLKDCFQHRHDGGCLALTASCCGSSSTCYSALDGCVTWITTETIR